MQSDDSWEWQQSMRASDTSEAGSTGQPLPHTSKTTAKEEPIPESGNEEDKLVSCVSLENVTESNSSENEPPVPGEEPNSSSYANSQKSNVLHHKFEIPSQLLDEAKNDPLAAFNKLMAARDKEKGIDPERYYRPTSVQPAIAPFPPQFNYPPPPFFPTLTGDHYRHPQPQYLGPRHYQSYERGGRQERPAYNFRDKNDYPVSYHGSRSNYHSRSCDGPRTSRKSASPPELKTKSRKPSSSSEASSSSSSSSSSGSSSTTSSCSDDSSDEKANKVSKKSMQKRQKKIKKKAADKLSNEEESERDEMKLKESNR